MNIHVNTPLQACNDCKWFSLDTDVTYLDGIPYSIWFCRYHAICETAIELYRKEKEDIVPVIKCKDCRHHTNTPHKSYCPINKKVVDRDEFCSWAERKDNETD